MKKFRVIAVLAIAFCFLFGTTVVYGYDHGISVSGGNGSIEDGDISATAVTFTSGDVATVNGKNVTPPEDKYFAIGLKLAGHDNDEVFADTAILDVTDPSSLVYNEDAELVVAYGLKSNMVKYTISYIDQNGAELLPTETHYGVIGGERPIISYKYVEGYLPHAYNITRHLSENPDDNVFTFNYTPVQAAEGQTIINNAGNANAAAGNAAGNAAAGNAAAGNAAGNAGANAGANAGTTIGDNATPLAIDDQDTPLANPDEEEKDGGSPLMYIIGGVVVAAAIAAAIAAFLARRRGTEEE